MSAGGGQRRGERHPPAEDGDGFVLRLLKPSDGPTPATVTLGLPSATATATATATTLDETGDDGDADLGALELGPHSLCTPRIRPSP